MFLTGLKTLLLAALSALFGLWLAAPTRADEPESASAVKPFNGKNLEGWTFKEPKDRSKWNVGIARLSDDNPAALAVDKSVDKPGELVNAEGGGVDIYTLEEFGDCMIRVEVMVPKGSNSGIYVMGEYEVQVLDSFGKERVGPGDMGGLYGASAPRVNAAKKPGEWQTFVIDFQAPRFEDGKKTANARFLKVELNDQVIHENVEMKGPTPSGITGQEAATGPLMFQGDHGAVAYRNLAIEPK